MRLSRTIKWTAGLALATALGACSGNYAAKKETGPKPGPTNKYDPEAEGLFGEGGFSLTRVLDGSLLDGDGDGNTGSAAPCTAVTATWCQLVSGIDGPQRPPPR